MAGTAHDRPDRRRAFAIAQFLREEAAGAVVLLAAAIVGVVWANSPWQDGYHDLLGGEVRHWVDEGLMAVFFLVVGLEIKRELIEGELRERRAALVPALAALGGMVLPAVIYAACNSGGAGSRGWGVPMATDIAFAVGVVTVAGSRVPPSLKLFLLTLAIVDDIGAIVVIAVFYASDIDVVMLALAVAVTGAYVFVRHVEPLWVVWFGVAGVAVWALTYRSGVHATIAGVVVGLLAPVERIDQLEKVLVPWSSFVVVPLFALVNAGVTLRTGAFDAPGTTRVAVGIAAGLLVGKPLGITGATWLAVRFRVGRLPAGASWRQLTGVATVAGIGFTVSLFVAGLAFPTGSPIEDAAKIAILGASLCAALLGTLVLSVRTAGGRRR